MSDARACDSYFGVLSWTVLESVVPTAQVHIPGAFTPEELAGYFQCSLRDRLFILQSAFRIWPTHRSQSHQKAMEPTTKKAADRVHQHREDGEEAIKRTGKVVPIDSGKDRESVQVNSDNESQLEKNATGRSKTD